MNGEVESVKSNHRLLMVDYFDELVNEIDLDAERFLIQHQKSDNHVISNLNLVRSQLIDEIHRIKSRCLFEFTRSGKIFCEYCFRMKHGQTGETSSRSSEDMFVLDYLVVTDRQISSSEIDILKLILAISIDENEQALGHFFNLTIQEETDDDEDEILKARIKINSQIANEILSEESNIIRLKPDELFAVHEVVLDRVGLGSIKPEFWIKLGSSLKILDLPANQIERISDVICPNTYHKMIQLDLSHNLIEHLDPLVGLTNLKTLILSGNKITQLTGQVFNQLANLECLFLDKNKLQLVEYFVDNLPNLKVLSLARNQISSIPAGFFANSKGLTHLDLSYNQLNSIRPGPLTPLLNLNTLYLKSNQIESLGKDSFQGLAALKSLNLSKNKINWHQVDKLDLDQTVTIVK